MPTIYYADHEQGRAVPVECTASDRDAAGRPILAATHFGLEADAWQCVLDNAAATTGMKEVNVRDARENLRRVSFAHALAVARESRIRLAYEAWKLQHSKEAA
jgi:hypothetical protein